MEFNMDGKRYGQSVDSSPNTIHEAVDLLIDRMEKTIENIDKNAPQT